MTTIAADSARTYAPSLRNLYFTRFAFAVIWVVIMFATLTRAEGPSGLLTVLLIVYPLFDAGAVLWQMRRDPDKERSKAAEWANVIVSVAVAIALGITSSIAISGALVVWGLWAIVSGVPQLIVAIRNRRAGGQVAQMLSGGISVLAGAGFVLQGVQGGGALTGAAGYAALGGIFFLISAIRLSSSIRKARA